MQDFIIDFFYHFGQALFYVFAIIFILFTVIVGLIGFALTIVLCFGGFTWIRLSILVGIILYYCILYALFKTIESR